MKTSKIHTKYIMSDKVFIIENDNIIKCEVVDITNLTKNINYIKKLVDFLKDVAKDGGLNFWNEMDFEKKSRFTFENWKDVAILMHENMSDDDILDFLGKEYRKDFGIIEHSGSHYCLRNI